MRVADDVTRVYELSEAFALMGTEANLDQLKEQTPIDPGPMSDVGPEDLMLVVVASERERAKKALSEMQTRLDSSDVGSATATEASQDPGSLPAAVEQLEGPALALISVPGEYAVREAWLALHEGLHVHCFSDNVSVEDERALKEFGRANDLLVMGPDCGTAIIDGLPLGFANVVSRGSVGIVSASGTGLQEVASLLDRAGGGVSQAIGTGGRDLQDDVGGLTTCHGIELLDTDETTDCIVVVSKPPEPEAREAVLETVSECETPVVVQFLGTDGEDITAAGTTAAETLTEAATLAAESIGANASSLAQPSVTELAELLESRPIQGDVRGLFSGGTLCIEAALLLADCVEEITTNIGVGKPVQNPLDSSGNVLIDLGADELTQGRPHPMIEPARRDRQLETVLADDDVGVVLVDVVLGRGVHEDPAAGIIEAIDSVASPPTVVASVCGTDADPQSRTKQVERLQEAGVIVAPSNAVAASAVGAAVGKTVSGGGVTQ